MGKVNVLITGASGFVGSHLLEHVLDKTDWSVSCIESFRHKGVSERIADSEYYAAHKDRVTIYTHDLTTPFSDVFLKKIGDVDIIINVASESHVTRSIEEPASFIQNNVNLMINMLELARIKNPKKFIHVSTDEVYGPSINHDHVEWDTHLPSSPYAASKSAQESICFSYWRTFGVPVVITNTMNIFGERQDTEKYIPLIMKKVLNGETVSIHAKDGQPGKRFYLHARNQADALLFIALNHAPNTYPESGRPSKFHVVGEVEHDNVTIAQKVAEIIGKPLHYELIDAGKARPGHDLRYAMDGTKLKEAGWSHPVPFHESLERTVQWTLAHPEWL